MVLRFGEEQRYKSPDPFKFSENLASALEDPTIIEKKLQEDQDSGRGSPVYPPSRLFLYSPLGLFPKHDRDWRRIHYLSILMASR